MKPGSTGFWVSDIKLTGYQEDTAFVDNADYTANFCLLDFAGRTTKEKGKFFQYIDPVDWDNGGWMGGGWYDADTESVVALGENDLMLKPAQAIWLELPVGDGEHPVSFQTSGQVIEEDIDIELVEGGNTVGNPMATPVWVSGLALTGYEEDTAFVDNADYTANFCLLDFAGRTTKEKGKFFQYINAVDWDNGGWIGGLWFDADTVEIVPEGSCDAQIAPGQGLWFEIPVGDGEHKVQLTFPAPQL